MSDAKMEDWGVEQWSVFISDFTQSPGLKDEEAAIRVCELAIEAARLGTYGVGALLLGDAGEILIEAHNEVHVGDFRSDLHAEMVVVNKFEAMHEAEINPGKCTLVTSLEPCPMCMTRLIFAGIGTILHVCPDSIGGMVQRKSSLPPVFQQITSDLGQVWEHAECSGILRDAAFHIWDASREKLDRQIPGRRNRSTCKE